MTVSIGVACLGEIDLDGSPGEGLVALADERLYDAKRAGKNRVRPAGPAPEPDVADQKKSLAKAAPALGDDYVGMR
jgi:hypothetical protein